MYIFPRAGPQLLMTIHMLVDLWHFTLLIGFFTFAFTASLYALSLNSADRAAEYASAFVADADDTPQAIFKHLVEAELNAEPMNLLASLGDYGEQEWCKWAIVCLFGCLVVLLLFNLLIAVFSKSVETLSQDLDAIFKLKFGQLVMRARGAPLAPRPLHFVRAAILLCYSALDFLSGQVTGGGVGEWAERLLLEVRDLVLGRVSAQDDSGPQSEDIGSDHDIVAAFLERAISKEVRLLPEGILDSMRRLAIVDGGHGHESAHFKQSDGSNPASERTADDDEWRREVSHKLEAMDHMNRKLDALTLAGALEEVNKKLESLGDVKQKLDSLTLLVQQQIAGGAGVLHGTPPGSGASVSPTAAGYATLGPQSPSDGQSTAEPRGPTPVNQPSGASPAASRPGIGSLLCQGRRNLGSPTFARVVGQAFSTSGVTVGDITVLADKRTTTSGPPMTRWRSNFSKGGQPASPASSAFNSTPNPLTLSRMRGTSTPVSAQPSAEERELIAEAANAELDAAERQVATQVAATAAANRMVALGVPPTMAADAVAGSAVTELKLSNAQQPSDGVGVTVRAEECEEEDVACTT